jgi:hypothetical protein
LIIQPRVKEVIVRNNVTGFLLTNRSRANRNIRLSDIASVSSTASNMQIKSATAGYIATWHASGLFQYFTAVLEGQ